MVSTLVHLLSVKTLGPSEKQKPPDLGRDLETEHPEIPKPVAPFREAAGSQECHTALPVLTELIRATEAVLGPVPFLTYFWSSHPWSPFSLLVSWSLPWSSFWNVCSAVIVSALGAPLGNTEHS